MRRAMTRWAAVWLVWATVAGAQGNEQRRLEVLGQTPREQQRAAANQAFLQGWLRRSAMLYLHRLDALTCRQLFSLGDEARFAAAIGNGDGTDHNLVFLDGAGAPSHLDSGPYVFPADTFRAYWPATADATTWWHEVNHALLDEAGVGVAPAGHGASMDNAGEAEGLAARFRTTSDDHHVLVEGVGQRGSEAYGELLGFETAVRRADTVESEYLAQGRDVTEYALQRQVWGDAHQRFSAFTQRMKRVAGLAPTDVQAYRDATGVFFSTAAQVAEWYRQGGLKRQERGEVTGLLPPAWVFYPDLLLMPVQVLVTDAKGQDLEQPGTTLEAKVKDDVYRLEFQARVRARGSAARRTGNGGANRLLGGLVGQGHLRVQVVEDDDLAGLALGTRRGDIAGVDGPGGPSVRLFDVDLGVPSTLPISITFARRKVSKVTKPTTFHVKLEYADAAQSRRYDSASAQVAFTVGVAGNSAPAPAAQAERPPPPPPTAVPAGTPTPAGQRDRRPLGYTVSWGPVPAGFQGRTGASHEGGGQDIPSKGSQPLLNGPNIYFQKGKWTEDGTVVEMFAREWAGPIDTLEQYVELARPTEPKSQGWFNSHIQSETTVGGYRAYMAVRDPGGKQINRHFSVVLDAKRRLLVSILSDTYPGRRSQEDKVALDLQVQELVRTFRFTPDDASAGLTVTRSVDKPLPPALQDVPVTDDQVDPRPPPPPPKVVRRDRRKTAAPTTGGATTPPPPTGTATTGPRPAAGPGGAPPPPPPGTATTGPRPAAGPGGAPPPPPPGTATTGPRPTVPTTTPPPAADPAAALQGTIAVRPNGADTAVVVTNTSRTTWHDCTFIIPQGLAFKQRSLDGSGSREVLWRYFKPLPGAPLLTREVLVQCREGTLRSPAPL